MEQRTYHLKTTQKIRKKEKKITRTQGLTRTKKKRKPPTIKINKTNPMKKNLDDEEGKYEGKQNKMTQMRKWK